MVKYEVNKPITPQQFVNILERSGLAERRPVDDAACMTGMIENSDLLVTAWEDDSLIGVARSVTDFSFCCYLSELAVDRKYQSKGIGKELVARTQVELGAHCMIVLLSAPAAVDYYPHIGMEKHPHAWILLRDKTLKRTTKPMDTRENNQEQENGETTRFHIGL